MIECCLSQHDGAGEFALSILEVIILSLDWGEVISSPLLPGVVELLLGLNAGLGGGGGGSNGSGSSSFNNWLDALGRCVHSQFLLSSNSDLLSLDGLGEVETGLGLITSKWGNLCNEGLKEISGTLEIRVGSSSLFSGKSLPTGDGELVLGGGVEDGLFARDHSLCFTDLILSRPVGQACFIGFNTNVVLQFVVVCSEVPVSEPDVGLSCGS